jgi:hypothetical protein
MVEAIEEGRLKPGDKVAMCAFGAGLSWATVVMQFGVSAEGERALAEDFVAGGKALYNARRAVNAVQDRVQNVMLAWQMRRASAKAAAKKAKKASEASLNGTTNTGR